MNKQSLNSEARYFSARFVFNAFIGAFYLFLLFADGYGQTRRPILDFYGSGRTSFAVFNNTGSNIVWKLCNNTAAGNCTAETVFWGTSASDVLTPGYFDADNRADISVWRPSLDPSQNIYFIRQSNASNALLAVRWGLRNDLVGREGDYDGDSRTDPTVVRRINGQWHWIYLRSSDNQMRVIPFGIANGTEEEDIPLPAADYTGDGRDDLAVWRRDAQGPETFIIGDSQTGAVLLIQPWGEAGSDILVVGDFIGDERADFAVWRGLLFFQDAHWYIKENGGNGFVARHFGISGNTTSRDIPVAGDYNGDGKSDIAVYRRSNNTFYWLNSPGFNSFSGVQFGQPGDIPVAITKTVF